MQAKRRAYLLYICIGFSICCPHQAQAADFFKLVFALPSKLDEIMTKHSILFTRLANATVSRSVKEINEKSHERINHASQSAQTQLFSLGNVLEAHSRQWDYVLQRRTDHIHDVSRDLMNHAESKVPTLALCGVAMVGAGLGLHHAINNVDYTTKPEQSGKKLLFGSTMAVLSTGYLYKRYRDFHASPRRARQ